jgi:hypothetical protein
MQKQLIILFSPLAFSLVSCTHITLLGHESAYDVNAEFSGDPMAPISLNAGFEGRSFAAVPPRRSVKWHENFNPERLPKGDVLSTMLELKIEKVPTQGQYGGVPFDYVTSGATGLAADVAAKSEATGEQSEATGQNNKIAEKIQRITDSGSETFGDL